jgi:hypothetical protein
VPRDVNQLTNALRPWLEEALTYIKHRPDLIAEVSKCLDGNGDLRVVFHVCENGFTIEVADYSESTFTEIFRQNLVPGGFGLRILSNLEFGNGAPCRAAPPNPNGLSRAGRRVAQGPHPEPSRCGKVRKGVDVQDLPNSFA